MRPIVLKEHEKYEGGDLEDLLTFIKRHDIDLVGMSDEYMGVPDCLGVNSNLEASYYIGASWIVRDKLPIIVHPKYDDLDFVEMLITALSINSTHVGDYFSKCYGIDFEAPLIETTEKTDQLTPLLLIHFLTLLEKVVQRGLKKGYISIEENLKSKIKGHIILSEQLRRNIIPNRLDRNYCRYQIYTSDIPENRLLKKALLFSQLMLNNMIRHCRQKNQIQNRINKLNTAFEGVSDIIEISQVKSISFNKLFAHYPEAIRVAKNILKRFDFSISNVSSENHKTPPFWIDMSRLFEVYVYSKLTTIFPNQIIFQVPGNGGVADFLHLREQVIIDAKYKPLYKEDGFKIEDIREICGYSRDKKLLENFGKDFFPKNEEIKCMIIYPGRKDINEEESLWNQSENIRQFRNFRKFGLSLPLKSMYSK